MIVLFLLVVSCSAYETYEEDLLSKKILRQQVS